VVEIRPIRLEDVAEAEVVWNEAITDVRRRQHLPIAERDPASARRMQTRVGHLLGTDPNGSLVAAEGARVLGVAQALIRERFWVLSLFGVHPTCQTRGIGRQLLDHALSYGGEFAGTILSSRDPRAMRRYALAGFELHPATTAWGHVQRSKLPAAPRVRPGDHCDLAWIDEIDRNLRGASHGADLPFLLDQGAHLLVIEGAGYALVHGDSPVFLGARTEVEAQELLAGALATVPDDQVAEVNWITAPQQWAIQTVLTAGLELYPQGPVMLRGRTRPPVPYLPSGAFG
jgi:ribosomal protein S18 acetylase RimI-like enzyme